MFSLENIPDAPSGNPDYPASQAERRKARRHLARMDRMEDFARKGESMEETYPDLPAWELACQRQQFAEIYERLVGVHPSQREILQQQLEQLQLDTERSVDEVIESVRRQAEQIDVLHPATTPELTA